MVENESSLIIPSQLGLYEHQAESWTDDSLEMTACLDLEAIVSLGLSLFGSIARIDTVWSSRVGAGERNYNEQEARRLGDWYAQWLKPCHALMADIAALEERGYEVAGAAEFRRACHEVRAKLSIPLERVLRVNINDDSGGGRSITEVRDGLRRRL